MPITQHSINKQHVCTTSSMGAQKDLHTSTRLPVETAQGNAEFDAFHLHAPVRRLRNKPLAEFNDSDQYLHVIAAQSKGLITADVGVR